MYDIAADVYRLRPLTEAPLDPARLEFRDHRERIAHDLLVRRGAVKIVSENRIPGTGPGTDRQGGRRPRTSASTARRCSWPTRGRSAQAECTCPPSASRG